MRLACFRASRRRARRGLERASLVCLLATAGCDVFDDQLERRVASETMAKTGCQAHADCGAQPSRACVKSSGECVAIESPDCALRGGDLEGDAIVLGALFATTGPTAGTNLARLESALLAVEEINAVGGVPGPGTSKRHLALVACDAQVDVRRAARHLVDELKVPAIVGPNTSQDTIGVSNEISVKGGTLLLTPSAVASSIADLMDNDLTWMMAPSDEQRAPLMVQQINQLEADLRAVRGERPIKLSIIHRNDALGMGTRVGLNTLTLNGESLVQNQTNGAVSIEAYDPNLADQGALVERQRAFAPDIVVLGGLAEGIDRILVALEQRWSAGAKPYYLLIDSLKGPELLKAVTGNDDLRKRVRGTGIVPTARSTPVFEAFQLAYQTKYPGKAATVTGMGPSYDAVHALAYALAFTRDQPPSGASIARGLDKLHDGALEVELASTKILAAFYELAAGKPITAVSTFGPLHWDDRGAPFGGAVEVWCIADASQPRYGSSGLTLDLETLTYAGEYRQCER